MSHAEDGESCEWHGGEKRVHSMSELIRLLESGQVVAFSRKTGEPVYTALGISLPGVDGALRAANAAARSGIRVDANPFR